MGNASHVGQRAAVIPRPKLGFIASVTRHRISSLISTLDAIAMGTGLHNDFQGSGYTVPTPLDGLRSVLEIPLSLKSRNTDISCTPAS